MIVRSVAKGVVLPAVCGVLAFCVPGVASAEDPDDLATVTSVVDNGCYDGWRWWLKNDLEDSSIRATVQFHKTQGTDSKYWDEVYELGPGQSENLICTGVEVPFDQYPIKYGASLQGAEEI